MTLRVVIFDLGGVLLRWEPERAFEQVIPADQVRGFMERIGFAEWNAANDAGRDFAVAEDELIARFPADAEAIRGYRRHFLATMTGQVPGTADILEELVRGGVGVFALTNWAAPTFAVARDHHPILATFADIIVSGEENLAKPDPEIYRIACQRAGVAPAEAVFVDDSPVNVAAARSCGLHGLHFTDASHLRADLTRLTLLPLPQ